MVEPETLAGIVDRLRRQAFTASFEPSAQGLYVPERGKTYRPEELTIRKYYRFEGASDPDDLSVVYAIEAADGTRGVLVDAFGAYADPRLGDILRHVAVRPAAPGLVNSEEAPGLSGPS